MCVTWIWVRHWITTIYYYFSIPNDIDKTAQYNAIMMVPKRVWVIIMALGHSQGNSAIYKRRTASNDSILDRRRSWWMYPPPPIISLNMLLYLVTSSYYHALLYYIALHSCGTEQTIDAARLYNREGYYYFPFGSMISKWQSSLKADAKEGKIIHG